MHHDQVLLLDPNGFQQIFFWRGHKDPLISNSTSLANLVRTHFSRQRCTLLYSWDVGYYQPFIKCFGVYMMSSQQGLKGF